MTSVKKLERLREAAHRLKAHMLPYEDESGEIRFTLGHWADFAAALAEIEEDTNG